MNNNQNDQELMKKAAARVAHRIGLIVHIVFWLVISAIIWMLHLNVRAVISR